MKKTDQDQEIGFGPSALKAINRELDRILAEEGITKEILDYVDLDVACSPVIVIRGESLRDAVQVSESSDPDKFLIRHWQFPNGFCRRGELKIMRARYLLARQGPPNPNPIATFRTDTEEGLAQAKDFFSKLHAELAKETP